MFTATIVTHLCVGIICRWVHGDEQRFPLRGRYKTLEQCVGEAELVGKFAGMPEPWRVECMRADEH